jgi:hypothetical protein
MFNHQPMVRCRRLEERLGPVLAGFLGLAGSAGCDQALPEAAAQGKEGPARVRTAPVGKGPIDKPIRGTGVVLPKQTMDLSFKLGGVLASVDVDDGQRVKKGQVLARIDPTEVAANVAQAQEGLAKAERDAARTRTLHDGKVVTQSDLDNARPGVDREVASVAAGFNPPPLLVTPATAGSICAPPSLANRRTRTTCAAFSSDRRLGHESRSSTATHSRQARPGMRSTQRRRTPSGKVENIATAADPRTGFTSRLRSTVGTTLRSGSPPKCGSPKSWLPRSWCRSLRSRPATAIAPWCSRPMARRQRAGWFAWPSSRVTAPPSQRASTAFPA